MSSTWSTLAKLPQGARVACALPSHSPELAACFIALTGSARLAFAPLNPDLTNDSAAFELSDLPAAALIVPTGKPGDKSPARHAAAALKIPVLELVSDLHTCGLFTLRYTEPDDVKEPQAAPTQVTTMVTQADPDLHHPEAEMAEPQDPPDPKWFDPDPSRRTPLPS